MDATLTHATLESALGNLLALQHEDGCWEGEMVWCTMILSQYVIVHHLLGRRWDDDTRQGIVRHFESTRTADGAWGLHPESHGYVFNTTLAYIALRLLGMAADEPLTASARRWLHDHPEGVAGLPAWGKFWLALVNLAAYDEVNPTLPELFLLPGWLPFHPSRLYCHTRYIYLAMSCLYGMRFKADLGTVGAELRRELHIGKSTGVVAATDLHVPPSLALRAIYRVLRLYDRFHSPWLRRRALAYCRERILYEQRNSAYHGLSPVNALLNCLVLISEQHQDLPASVAGLEAWRWEDAAEGIRFAGARSQTWDTAFAMQALLDGPAELSNMAADGVRRGYAFLRQAQMTEELPVRRRECRDAILGGWCFSDGAHRWPVSDCSAEALCAVLAAHRRLDLPADERIPDDRLMAAARFILDRQNSDGGFGTYERRRGPRVLEALNPSEMYGSCMLEGSYIECTGSALAALAYFRESYPYVLRGQIDRAMRRGASFLRRAQRPDGAWPGFWGVNFTYGAFHAVKGLRAASAARSDPAIQLAAQWLIDKQRDDGGWGEHFQGCLENRYVERDSQPVMTSWALLTLMEAFDADAAPICRGIGWLREHQQENGAWQQSAVSGVFFGTAMLDYRLYKAYFPTWALARHQRLLQRQMEKSVEVGLAGG